MNTEYRKSLKLITQQCENILGKMNASEDLSQDIASLYKNWQSTFDTTSKLHRLSPLIPSIKIPQDVWNLLVPIEREMGVERLETDFLVETEDKICKSAPRSTVIVLENIRSAFNVGSIFRSSEAFNIHCVYCCGYTPTPENQKVTKTTMNTEKNIDWKHYVTLDLALENLKDNGYKIIGAETTQKSQDINNLSISSDEKYAVLFGNERFGLSEKALSVCDEIVEIPLTGQKNSLNIGVAVGIFLYRMSQ